MGSEEGWTIDWQRLERIETIVQSYAVSPGREVGSVLGRRLVCLAFKEGQRKWRSQTEVQRSAGLTLL